jgi:hypothetical protein
MLPMGAWDHVAWFPDLAVRGILLENVLLKKSLYYMGWDAQRTIEDMIRVIVSGDYRGVMVADWKTTDPPCLQIS